MSSLPEHPTLDLDHDVVGVIPAAGRGTRLQPLNCSKEIVPVGQVIDSRTGLARPKVAVEYLLAKFRRAGIARTVIVLREGKWDIPAYLQEGGNVGMSLAYVVIPGSLGPPDTIDRAYAFVARCRVAFGFPDILFEPEDGFARLIAQQDATGADVVLGLQRIEQSHLWDMVDTDVDGRVRAITMKPAKTSLIYGWHFAVWTPRFTEFLHRFLQTEETRRNLSRWANKANDPGGDLAVGVVFQEALKAGLVFQSVKFAETACLDVGTPENLAKAARTFAKS